VPISLVDVNAFFTLLGNKGLVRQKAGAGPWEGGVITITKGIIDMQSFLTGQAPVVPARRNAKRLSRCVISCQE
jgi:hypothetical protein